MSFALLKSVSLFCFNPPPPPRPKVASKQELEELRGSLFTKARRKALAAEEDTDPFRAIKIRIVLLLGRMGGRLNYSLGMLPGDTSQHSDGKPPPWMAWDTTKHLKYAVPFLDMKADIFLDPLLPRVVDLARTSGDRQTKVCLALGVLSLF